MLLTNQKTINYETYIKKHPETTPFVFCKCKSNTRIAFLLVKNQL